MLLFPFVIVACPGVELVRVTFWVKFVPF